MLCTRRFHSTQHTQQLSVAAGGSCSAIFGLLAFIGRQLVHRRLAFIGRQLTRRLLAFIGRQLLRRLRQLPRSPRCHLVTLLHPPPPFRRRWWPPLHSKTPQFVLVAWSFRGHPTGSLCHFYKLVWLLRFSTLAAVSLFPFVSNESLTRRLGRAPAGAPPPMAQAGAQLLSPPQPPVLAASA